MRYDTRARAAISVEEIVAALEAASAVPAAGFHVDGGQEYLVRGLGRVLLVNHYEHLMRDEGLPLRDAVLFARWGEDVAASAEPREEPV